MAKFYSIEETKEDKTSKVFTDIPPMRFEEWKQIHPNYTTHVGIDPASERGDESWELTILQCLDTSVLFVKKARKL
ncbi:MAG: hypothetical protein HOG49_14340 [Candidatus Scalindua sp.]|jgi:hypothetical protein|nr:hypothetical protein [Candidatus Scalindua sp.]